MYAKMALGGCRIGCAIIMGWCTAWTYCGCWWGCMVDAQMCILVDITVLGAMQMNGFASLRFDVEEPTIEGGVEPKYADGEH